MTKKITYLATLALMAGPIVSLAQESADESDSDLLDQVVPVAEEAEPILPPASDGPQQAEDTFTEEQLLDEFARYRRLIEGGTLDEADTTAKRIVEMSIRIYGPRSRETASSLNNLGIVQHRNGQYDAAIQNFTSAVEIIELVEDRLHDGLVNPLKGLGAAQLSIGRPDQARKTFDRAMHITQVNEGPHNIGQVEILESIAESYMRMNEFKQARNILDRIHIINVKFFEQDPMGLLPSLMSRASWQHRAGFYAEERVTYRRIIRTIESSHGKQSPMLVEPLRRLGESFYYVDLSMALPQQQGVITSGEPYFRRSVKIAENAENMDWRESTRSRIALADYYNFTESTNRARKLYFETWEFLSTDEERLAVRDELFAKPSPIQVDVLPDFAGGGPIGDVKKEDIRTGRIVVTFNVTATGRVRQIRSEAFPAEFTDMQRMAHREIRVRRYRPKLIDGVGVAVTDMQFIHEFKYFDRDLERRQEALKEEDQKRKR